MKCNYCEKAKATIRIRDPNLSSTSTEYKFWDVCENCKKMIGLQQLYSIGVMSGNKDMQEWVKERMDRIAEKTGEPYVIFTIKKKGVI